MAKERKDLTGMRFGRLTAISPTKERNNGSYVWECQCDCGNTKKIVAYSLLNGNTSSCGCIRSKKKKPVNIKESVNRLYGDDTPCSPWSDLQGRKFGMLTPVRPTTRRWRGNVVWECLCDCGTTTYMCVTNLKRGKQPSCGCTRNIEDLTGQKFGKFTVMRHMGVLATGPVTWECKCDCGNTAYVAQPKLKSGEIRSCGCI